jgi:hypothetical protein
VYTATVTCITCDVDAASVGFEGYLGTPSLSSALPAKLAEVDGEAIPFGYLYEPLRAILLRPRDLEEMHDFLTVHQGHQVAMWGDSQDVSDWSPELVALLARREANRAEQADQGEDVDCVLSVAGQEPGWVFGHYQVRCFDCRKKHALEEPEALRAFDRQPLSRTDVGMMLARWGKLAPDDGWNHALRPAVDPYGPCMEGLLGFLRRHREHRLEAQHRPVGR